MLDFFDIGCVWRHFFGVECPGCGMTRSVLSFLRGDIRAAFAYHPMFWSLPIILLYILYDGRLFKNNLANYLPLAVIGAGFAVNYAVKLAVRFGLFC